MGKVLLCYGIALLLLAGGVYGSLLYMKKVLKAQWKGKAFFGGILIALCYFLGIILLFRFTFSSNMYYDTPFFRTVVGFLYLALLALVRFMILKFPFFNHYRESGGHSLSLGFGLAPAAFLSVYALLMFFVVLFNGIFNGPCIVESEGLLSFADNTMISVFQPVAGHVSFAALFAIFGFFNLLFSRLIERITNERISLAVAILWPVALFALEAIMLLPIPFIKMYDLAHYALPIIAGICAGIAFLLVQFMPTKKKEAKYIKQFE